MQLTIETFPKQRPNITLQDVLDSMEDITYNVNTQEVRLAIELAKQRAPMQFDLHDTVRSILQCDISNERINAVKSFKKIIHKKVIECVDGKHKTVKKLRRRSK